MANTPVYFPAAQNLTLTLEMFAFTSPDTVANSPGDTCTELTNSKGMYTAVVSEPLSGLYTGRAKDSNDLTHAIWHFLMVDTTDPVYYSETPAIDSVEVAGGVPFPVTVTDTSLNPLDGVACWVTSDVDGNNIVAGVKYTNTSGYTEFNTLEAGDYYLWRQLKGHDIPNPLSITVS